MKKETAVKEQPQAAEEKAPAPVKEVPSVRQNPFEDPLILPVGVIDETGTLQRELDIKPMTGRVRKEILDPKNRKNGARIVSTILERCITRVGKYGEGDINRNFVLNMFSGDRDFALAAIRLRSVGSHLVLRSPCGYCGTLLDVHAEIDEFSVSTLEGIGPYEIEERDLTYRVESREHDLNVKMKLLKGRDQEAIWPKVQQNIYAGSMEYLYASILELNGKEKGPGLLLSVLENMELPALDWLDSTFADHSPGIERLAFPCGECGGENFATFDLADFMFRPGGPEVS